MLCASFTCLCWSSVLAARWPVAGELGTLAQVDACAELGRRSITYALVLPLFINLTFMLFKHHRAATHGLLSAEDAKEWVAEQAAKRGKALGKSPVKAPPSKSPAVKVAPKETATKSATKATQGGKTANKASPASAKSNTKAGSKPAAKPAPKAASKKRPVGE